MTPRRSAATAAVLALAGCSSPAAVLALAGCGSPAAGNGRMLEQTRAQTYSSVAQRLYDEEVHGQPSRDALRRIAAQRPLQAALLRNDRRAAIHALHHQPVRHAVRARIDRQSGTPFVDVGLPFVVGGEPRPLVGAGGRQLGTIEVSIQDVIGYVRLLRRLTGVEAVVRGSSGRHVSLLRGAAAAALPRQGSVTLPAGRFVVSFFARRGFAGEQLSIWVLAPVGR